MTSVRELYEIWSEPRSALDAEVARSLSPRGVDMLFDAFGRLGVGTEDVVLDAGCRDAKHAIELTRRFGCRAIGVDVVPLHVERARTAVAAAGADVQVLAGDIEALPLADESVDHVWCRDVLSHVSVDRGVGELARVLRRGGGMLVYQTFAAPALHAEEAARLYAATAQQPQSMSPDAFERAATTADLEIVEKDVVETEWRERMLEDGGWNGSEDLLAIARLRRRETDLVAQYGRAQYEAVLGGLLWGIYQILGKFQPTVYLLRRA